MTPMFDKAFRAVAKIVATLARLPKKIPARVARLKEKEMEAERLDRLRNPSNYQGR